MTDIKNVPIVLKVYHNHGRWVVDCPACNAGLLVRPGDTTAVCTECFPGINASDPAERLRARIAAQVAGRVYALEFPPAYRQIARLLAARPRAENRNWLPGEHVADLQRENELHEVNS